MKILIDDREKRPLEFMCETERKRLKTGDYALADQPNKVCIEAKHSVEDLCASLCLAKRRARFLKLGERAASFEHRWLITPLIADILRGTRYSKVPGHVILQKTIEWCATYHFILLAGITASQLERQIEKL